MPPIDHHVQNALYTFNREMRRLDQGTDSSPKDLEYQHIRY